MTKVLVLACVLFVVSITGCMSAQTVQNAYLPTNATGIVEKGNGWYEFELDGHKYLYFRHGVADHATAGVTRIK